MVSQLNSTVSIGFRDKAILDGSLVAEAVPDLRYICERAVLFLEDSLGVCISLPQEVVVAANKRIIEMNKK